MNLVHRNISQSAEENGSESLLKSWLMSNSEPTIKKFLELEKSNFKKPLNFSSKLLFFLGFLIKAFFKLNTFYRFSNRNATFSGIYRSRK